MKTPHGNSEMKHAFNNTHHTLQFEKTPGEIRFEESVDTVTKNKTPRDGAENGRHYMAGVNGSIVKKSPI